MSNVGERERATQNRLVQLFQRELGYKYLGNWQDRPNNRNIEVDRLTTWLRDRGVSDALINRALRQLDAAAALGEGKKLYYANKEVYRLLRYGAKDKETAGENKQTVWLSTGKIPRQMSSRLPRKCQLKGKTKGVPTWSSTLTVSRLECWSSSDLL
jgi:type I restriction enzyme R subunit